MADHTPPTDQQLDEIDARRQAATPGPWGTYQYGGDSLIEIAADLEDTGCGYRARRTVCRFDEEPLDNDPTHREWTGEEDWAQVQADAAFIAHAREDVDALAAEVRRLRAAATLRLFGWTVLGDDVLCHRRDEEHQQLTDAHMPPEPVMQAPGQLGLDGSEEPA